MLHVTSSSLEDQPTFENEGSKKEMRGCVLQVFYQFQYQMHISKTKKNV